MGEHFDKLKIGEFFEVEGEAFKKTSELMFESVAGRIEQMIDPIWDKKLGRTQAEKDAAAAKTTVDTSVKMVPSSESPDVDPSVVK